MIPQHGNHDAAVEVKGGTWMSAFSWGFGVALWKYWVIVDGVEHRIHFATPQVIPLRSGFQEVEFAVQGWFGGKYFRNRHVFTVAPGTIQPLTYRMIYSVWGWLFTGFKMTVIKPGLVRPYVQRYEAYGPQFGYAGTPHPPFKPHYPSHNQHAPQQQPQYQQPQHQPTPYQRYDRPAYQTHVQEQPGPHYTSTFTDSNSHEDTVAASATPSLRVKFCTQCGVELIACNRFCGSCGEAVS